MNIHIFSFLNAFGEGMHALHPGFSVDGTICVLTHTKPWKRNYIQIPAAFVKSSHFKARSDYVYLALAEKTAKRYNNAHGGFIKLDSLLLTKISNFLKKPTSSLTLKTVIMTEQKVSVLANIELAKDFLPKTQAELFPQEPSEEDLIPGTDNEVLPMPEVYARLANKDPEQIAIFAKDYPTQVSVVLGASLAATLKPVFPTITLQKTIELHGESEKIADLLEVVLNENVSDGPGFEALAALEEVVGLDSSLENLVVEEIQAPLTTSAPAEEETEVAPADGEETEVVNNETAVAVPVNNSLPASVTAKQVNAAKAIIASSMVIQNELLNQMKVASKLLENDEQPA
jgi:hypothetical protein